MTDIKDVIQLELVVDDANWHNTTFTVDENWENILNEFSTFLDALVQSNAEISSKENLEWIV